MPSKLRIGAALACAAFLLPAAGAFGADEKMPSQVTKAEVVHVVAEVTAIDLATRELTLAGPLGGEIDLQAGPETLLRTNLGEKSAGDLVNLERSLRVGDRLGGHFVQGHVDATASLHGRREEGEWSFLAFELDPSWTRLMVPKGSIAVDGVSLTVVRVDDDLFEVALIPHTQQVTTLGIKRPGSVVNLEVDVIAKYVERLLEGHR